MAQPAHCIHSIFRLQCCFLFLLASWEAGKVPSETKGSSSLGGIENREALFLSIHRVERPITEMNSKRLCGGKGGGFGATTYSCLGCTLLKFAI